MSKTDRLSFIRDCATRAIRVLTRCADAGLTVPQSARVLRRTCPRLQLVRNA